VYARDVDAKTLTFGVLILRWNRNFVMYDKDSGTLWSQFLGEAMEGPLRGKKLELIPSVFTTWKTWSREHPDGTVVVLKPTFKRNATEFYKDPDKFVLGIADWASGRAGKAKAWGVDRLIQAQVVNDTFAGRPVVILCDPDSLTVRCFAPEADGRQLTFEAKGGQVRDRETGSTWNAVTGEAVDGPLKGMRLRPLTAVLSKTKHWQLAHPTSQ
jgi:hypothetical protein